MNHKWKRRIKQWSLDLVLLVMLSLLISVWKNGMWLFGIPKAENVCKVTISCPRITDTVKTYTDAESIDLAVALTGFLKYSLLEKPEGSREEAVEITYELRDGQTVTVAADETTVWWKDRARALRTPGSFVYLVEVDFFSQELD